jgi:hypothetical protein
VVEGPIFLDQKDNVLDLLDAIACRWFRFDPGGHGFIDRS